MIKDILELAREAGLLSEDEAWVSLHQEAKQKKTRSFHRDDAKVVKKDVRSFLFLRPDIMLSFAVRFIALRILPSVTSVCSVANVFGCGSAGLEALW